MGALLPILSALIGGQSIGSILGAMTLTQWAELALALNTALPQLKAAYTALHPAFAKLAEDMTHHLKADTAIVAASKAASSTKSWLAANAEAAIRVQETMEGNG